MHYYALVGYEVLFVLFFCISGCEGMWTLKHVAGKCGESVTLPCLYAKQYKSNRKYWCAGYSWSSCTVVAYANTTQSTPVIDQPTRNMFTVQLNNLHESNSGWYWCAVEVGHYFNPDDKDYLYLTVSAAPAVSVLESRVSGEEGGSVHIQCFYSDAYQNQQKQWCRSTDRSCYTLGRTDPSQNAAVQINDDGKRSFMVEMTGLKKSDAGWYWCSVGDLQVPVHLSLSQSENLEGIDSTDEGMWHHSTILACSTVSGLLLLLTGVAVVIWMLKQKRLPKEGCRSSVSKGDVEYDPIFFSRTPPRDPNEHSPSKHDGIIYSEIISASQ